MNPAVRRAAAIGLAVVLIIGVGFGIISSAATRSAPAPSRSAASSAPRSCRSSRTRASRRPSARRLRRHRHHRRLAPDREQRPVQRRTSPSRRACRRPRRSAAITPGSTVVRAVLHADGHRDLEADRRPADDGRRRPAAQRLSRPRRGRATWSWSTRTRAGRTCPTTRPTRSTRASSSLDGRAQVELGGDVPVARVSYVANGDNIVENDAERGDASWTALSPLFLRQGFVGEQHARSRSTTTSSRAWARARWS